MKRNIAILGLTGALLVGSLAGPAVAQDEPEDTRTPQEQLEDAWEEARIEVLNGIKDHAQAAVEHRYQSLDEMRKWVREAEHISSGHASTLMSEYSSTESGLTALNEEIQATTTIEEALRLTEKIASDYRVYVVMVPKTIGVIFGDSIVAASDEIERSGADVQEAIDALDGYGFDVADAQASLNDAMKYAAEARNHSGGVADSVIGLTASDWPNPSNATLDAGRRNLEAGADDLRRSIESLVESIVEIHQLLRDGR